MRLNAAPAAYPQTAPDPEPAVAEPEPAASYLELYGLAKPPFGSAAEPAPFLLFNAHRSVFELMVAGLRQGAGHVLLVGEAGVGKSTCLAAALELVSDTSRRIIRVGRSLPGPITRPRLIAQILEVADPGKVTPDLLARARAAVAFRPGMAKPPILAIDDAHYLAPDALAWVLRVAGGRNADMPQVVLVARPGIQGMLADKLCKPFVDRIARSLELPPLPSGDMRQYVERRLWLAGSSTRRLFSGSALRVAIGRAEGSPGQIESLLEATLTAGFIRGEPILTARTVRTVAGRKTRRRTRAGDWGWVVIVLAVLVLLAGVGAFAYRAAVGG